MNKRLTLSLVLAVAALAGLAVFFSWQSGSQSPFWRAADPPVLVRQIQQLSELVTVKYTVQKVVGLEEKKFPVGSEKILLIVQAEVLAGVDLSRITVADVNLSGNGEAAIALPPPRILHVVVDEKQTKVWDRSVTWWTPWVPYNRDLERRARLAALDSVRETAVEMGILEDALRNAEKSVRALLEALGIDAVTFLSS